MQRPAQALSRTRQAALAQPRTASGLRPASAAERLATQLPEQEAAPRARAPLPRLQQGTRQPPHEMATPSKRPLPLPALAAAAPRPHLHLASPAGCQALALTLQDPRVRRSGALPS